MYPLGFLFGLGFDTATEIGLLSVAAAQGAKGLPLVSLLVFPTLFAAGMVLVDTLDSMVMAGAYRWAAVEPTRKLAYNLVITLVSVAVALAIGGIQLLATFSDKAPGIAIAGQWLGAAIEQHSAAIGAALVMLLAMMWAASLWLWRLRYRRAGRA